MMFQLIYASAATVEFSEESLAELLAQARKNNSELGVGGLLLYDDGCFLQVLEGSEDVVLKLYQHIEKDARHGNAQLLYRGTAEEPAFAEWSMGYVRAGADDVPDGYHHFLKSGFRRKLDSDGEVARRTLLAFREGRFRQRVEN